MIIEQARQQIPFRDIGKNASIMDIVSSLHSALHALLDSKYLGHDTQLDDTITIKPKRP